MASQMPPKIGDVMDGYTFMGGDPGKQTSWKPLTGDAFLKTLSPTDANVISAIADGRLQIPGGFSTKAPYWIQKIQQVTQFDPSFDANIYKTRGATRQAFTHGKQGQNIAAINTAISHMGQFADKISGVAGHSGFPFATTINGLINSYERGTGDPNITNYEVDQNNLAHELRRVFTVTGTGSEADLMRYINDLSPDASLDQKKGAIGEIVKLLAGRRDALSQEFRNGMGSDRYNLNISTPHADAVLSQLGLNIGDANLSEPSPTIGAPPAPRRPMPPPSTLPRKNAGGFQNGQIYQDANGNKAKYQNGQWIPQ